jgi:hypothetical protein
MADDFDRFLAQALAPPERMPDRRFVAGVQARIALEERLAAERTALIRALAAQLAALLAVAAGLWVIGRAAPVARLVSASPSLALMVMLGAFACLVLLFAQGDGPIGARA